VRGAKARVDHRVGVFPVALRDFIVAGVGDEELAAIKEVVYRAEEVG